jgi:hypothetical protein
MRAGSRGVVSKSAFVAVAVTPASQITPTKLESQFQAVGYEVIQQPRISRTRPDRAIILNAYRTAPTAEWSKQATTLMVVLVELAVAAAQSSILEQRIKSSVASTPTLRRSVPEFQPVWNIDTWSRTGLELFVANDDDASTQLDALAEGLGCHRTQLTIKPRVGWLGYGHPDVQDLG